jgi:hypothetical protein
MAELIFMFYVACLGLGASENTSEKLSSGAGKTVGSPVL